MQHIYSFNDWCDYNLFYNKYIQFKIYFDMIPKLYMLSAFCFFITLGFLLDPL